MVAVAEEMSRLLLVMSALSVFSVNLMIVGDVRFGGSHGPSGNLAP